MAEEKKVERKYASILDAVAASNAAENEALADKKPACPAELRIIDGKAHIIFPLTVDGAQHTKLSSTGKSFVTSFLAQHSKDANGKTGLAFCMKGLPKAVDADGNVTETVDILRTLDRLTFNVSVSVKA